MTGEHGDEGADCVGWGSSFPRQMGGVMIEVLALRVAPAGDKPLTPEQQEKLAGEAALLQELAQLQA